MTESEDQISPRAIKLCDLCHVPNAAIGGYTSDRRFVPFYKGDDPANPIKPKLGRRAWCGRGSPEHILHLQRIVCTPVEVDGETQNLCQRCARQASSLQRQEAAA